MFEKSQFIKADSPFIREYKEENPAPMFRKKFFLKDFKEAKLYVISLGMGSYWINGKKISQDLHTTAASDYNKTLWYNVYNVRDFLVPGENVLAIICGNGWYNETFDTPWDHNKAPWRDNPKVKLSLIVDEELIISTDESWKCTTKSPITFNQLRSGEYFDARLYDSNWTSLDYDDRDWESAIFDDNPPKGKLREYPCEPVREGEIYKAKSMIKTGEDRYLFDIGQNISGYIRLDICQESGDEIVIRYAEQINCDNALQYNNMDRFFPESPFQTDKFISNGERMVWSPMFVYHGFRYIELEGVKNPTMDMVSGVFIHLDLKETSSFSSSNPYLNHLFKLGKMATLSNLHHIPTDCPSREKLGWANDAQASAEQMMMNFGTKRFFEKWLIDIEDSIRDDGAIPGIIPSSGWGYEWGTGPVSSGVLFEIPYRIYRYFGDDGPLKRTFKSFIKHLAYIKSRADDDGLIGYGLCDWAGPFKSLEGAPTPVKFTDTILYIKCLKIALLAASRIGNLEEKVLLEEEIERISKIFKDKYIDKEGYSVIHEQTALSMLIYFEIYDSLEPIREQLKQTVEEHDFHHYCGMVGLRYLYDALNICGFEEYAYRIITARGYPSYSTWVDAGATTLWETWQPGNSKNHHMYSHFMVWMMKTLVGIDFRYEEDEAIANINPIFIDELDFCSGHIETNRGKIRVYWERYNEDIELIINMPENIRGLWRNKELVPGHNRIRIERKDI